ncbi:FAD-dependent oxidoreductase [Novosphingobium sp.]|uniref:NAD(P)/FAD-dependent oxidoreductase n=1 Tax=Novosphingobium sp. TaxID=1874826 RepID=UPI001EB6F76B|nr:FAD-dependent oxidoreductase [Novosphingobium sp.]MBK6801396.1 FAD-dependent oxidoreductase [Novosphingobium sp.]MBK9010093.1 FAD-dependent oxidoreductase [Novosphingobium sp.]
MKVAIVGAGMAGLACAGALRVQGYEPVLFDKGRRPGGRLSSLQLEDGMAWDFGAQFLLAGEGAFAAQVSAWRQAGLIAPWPEGPEGALVGVPAMSTLVAAQCGGHDVRFGAQVQRIEHGGDGWQVSGPGWREGPFGALIVATPAEQAAPLLSLHDLAMAREAAAARSTPCWTVMAAFDQPLAAVPSVLRDAGPIAWAARNSSKPGRTGRECWVIQAGAQWSADNLECDREAVAERLLALFAAQAGIEPPSTIFLKAHRWRFALPYGQTAGAQWNPVLRLGACGDWCLPGAIEGAWRSGTDLAARIACSLEAAPAESQRLSRTG